MSERGRLPDSVLAERVADALAAAAPGGLPRGLLERVVAVTGRADQRPRWLASVRQPTMRTRTRVTVGSPTLRFTSSALLALLMVVAVAAALLAGATLVRSLPGPAADWSGFRGDVSRSGAGAEGPVGQPALRWRYQASGSVFSNIAIAGGVVYASSDDGVLHAIDLDDGLVRWTYATDLPPLSGPTVGDRLVYVVDAGGTILALETADGMVAWTRPGPAGFPAWSPDTTISATLGDGAVFLGTPDGQLRALDDRDGSDRWALTISPGEPVAPPAFADGVVYAGGDAGTVVAVDARSGERRWSSPTGLRATGPPVIAAGVVYVGGSADRPGPLVALDAATGARLWDTGTDLLLSPAIAGDSAYSGSISGLVSARDTLRGAERWHVTIQGDARPPAVANGVVYVPGNVEHRVYALDARSGKELWRFGVDSGNDCCVAVSRGLVFVGTSYGGVYAIGGTGPSP